jgi:arylsulfatase A-like enzyme/Tfp pilus assembly protein PilF
MAARPLSRPQRLALVAAAIVLNGCGSAPPPDLILVTLDTVRADRIGAYGYPQPTTPRLDRLAASGALCERAYASAPITLPSHATLLTGLEPYAHGVRSNGFHRLPAAATTLAELLRRRGYRTAAVIGGYPLARRFGLDQGFEVYDDAFGAGAERPARAVARRALELLRGPAQKPLFLWVHFDDPHDPYEPLPRFDRFGADSGARYDGEIASADAGLGTVLDGHSERRGDRPALIAVAGDHGEGLGEHREPTHALFVYDSTLRVPLVIQAPGVRAGLRLAAAVTLRDLGRTLLDLAGASTVDFPGRSFAGALRGRTELEQRPCYAESYLPLLEFGWSPLRSIRERRWKYIAAPEPELYDLEADPGERHNLVAVRPRQAQRLAALLPQDDGRFAAAATLKPEEIAKLRSLGYLAGGSAPAAGDSGDRPDPKSMVEVHDLLLAAREARHRSDPAAAEPALQEAIERDPSNPTLRRELAQVLLSAGRTDEAQAELEAALAGAAPEVQAELRAELEQVGRVAALAKGELPVPGPALAGARGLHLAAAELIEAGRAAEAEPLLRQAIAAEPDYAPAHNDLGVLLSRVGKLDAAIAALRRAIQLDPRASRYRNALGVALARGGRMAEAAAAFRAALALDPDYQDARDNLRAAEQP